MDLERRWLVDFSLIRWDMSPLYSYIFSLIWHRICGNSLQDNSRYLYSAIMWMRV
jgi:hypothetical protein